MPRVGEKINKVSSQELSRLEDPYTSKLAASQIVEEGTHERMMVFALKILTIHPGSTARELDTLANRQADGAVRKRLNDLRKFGKAICRGKRRCRVTGRLAYLWFPTTKTSLFD